MGTETMTPLEEAFALFRPGWYLSLAADGKWAVLIQKETFSFSMPRPVMVVVGIGDSPEAAIQDAVAND